MQANCVVMKGGDGVEYFTHHSGSRHQGYISLVEESHHPPSYIRVQIRSASRIQPAHEAAILCTARVC